MLARDENAGDRPIESRDELIAHFEAGCKPKSDWRIGTEHEKFPFHTGDFSPVPYDGPSGFRRCCWRWPVASAGNRSQRARTSLR